MKYTIWITIWFCVAITSCAAKKTISLEWNENSVSSINYRSSIMEELSNAERILVDPQQLINVPRLSDKDLADLKAISINADKLPLLTSIAKKNNDNFEVKIVRAEIEFDAPPKDENEEREREFLQQLAGTVQ